MRRGTLAALDGFVAVGPRYFSLRLHFVRRLLLSLAIIENYASKSRKMHTSAWCPRPKAFVSITKKHAAAAAQRAAEDGRATCIPLSIAAGGRLISDGVFELDRKRQRPCEETAGPQPATP